MPTLSLANARCRVHISTERGGRVTSFRAMRDGVEGIEHVGAGGLQTWLKTGEDRDPAAGALMQFYGDFLGREFEVTSTTALGCTLGATDSGVRFEKQYLLFPPHPVLGIAAKVTNAGAVPLRLQIEHFFQWSFGPTTDRKNVVTALVGAGGTQRLYLPPYGDVTSRSYDAEGVTMALCDLDHRETLLLRAGTGHARYTVYHVAGMMFRGPYTPEQTLMPGESFGYAVRVFILPGVAAVDRIDTVRVTGLMPWRDVWFADETVRAAVSSGELSAKYAGETREETYNLGVGTHEVAAVIDGERHAASVRVLDPDVSPEPPSLPAPPDFAIRAVHLILSQQDNRGFTMDGLKWLLEHVIRPSGYTHAIFEFNSAMRLKSHPELAADYAFDAAEVAGVARFARSLGLEPIPQQNFYGHQHETNFARVFPELQEVPGDISVYCPTHPKTRGIAADIARELIDLFEPRYVHIGHDEIQFRGRDQRVGVCSRCRAFGTPAEVFAHDVNDLHAVIKRAGARTILWGDHLSHPRYGPANVNGELGEVYKAVDLIPRDIVINDWHYYPSENYHTNEYFLGKGFEVWNATWFFRENTVKFARHGKRAGASGMIMTSWTRPDLGSLPVEGLLFAGRCFQSIDDADRAEVHEQVLIEAHRLWRRWRQWQKT